MTTFEEVGRKVLKIMNFCKLCSEPINSTMDAISVNYLPAASDKDLLAVLDRPVSKKIMFHYECFYSAAGPNYTPMKPVDEMQDAFDKIQDGLNHSFLGTNVSDYTLRKIEENVREQLERMLPHVCRVVNFDVVAKHDVENHKVRITFNVKDV